MGRAGFTRLDALVVAAAVLVVLSIVVPSVLSATRAANERNVAGSLRQFGSIEVTFRTADLDGDKVENYWTSDVAGLYYFEGRAAT
jgi:hypothetical protein